VVDTGVLLAAADADDRWNERAADVLTSRRPDDLLVPAPVATETSWMIGSRLGPSTEAAFVASIAAGDLAVVTLSPEDGSAAPSSSAPTPISASGLSTPAALRSPNVSGSRPSPPSTVGTFSSSDRAIVRHSI
jgi:predicted nucleic acid-binding protein